MLSLLFTLSAKEQWYHLTDITHQTELCSSPRRADPKPWSRSGGGCLLSLLAPVGLHSCCCHWHPKTWAKGWASSLFSLVSIETRAMWPKQLDSVAAETPPLLSPLSPSRTPPSFPSPLLPLFTAHYSVQLFLERGHWGEGDVGTFILFVISSEWWPKTREFACSQLAKTTTENLCEEFKGSFKVTLK